MKRISKVILIALLMVVMAMGACGCSTADTVNYNLNKEANITGRHNGYAV